MEKVKRDMDLIRKILLNLEQREENDFSGYFSIEGYPSEKVDYHLELMVEKGLLKGKFAYADDRMIFSSLSISWEGHDFLESIKNDTVWNNTKESIKEKGLEIGQISFDVLKEFAKLKIKETLGLL